MTKTDVTLMRAALDLARRGPVADPNPRVGAVVVDRDGHIVGTGFHRGAGTPHAEVVALAAAGDRARGATAVVTLEPCNHTGRTGPCSQALLAAGVARVVYAQSDPHAAAAGGAQTLHAAGVRVEGGLLAAEAAELNQAWTFAMVSGRPRVVWKFAATLDGRSAAADGTSRWITGPAARADVHLLRAQAGAVLVGTGTVLADDPSLTVRNSDGELTGRQPLRVVMGHRPLPPDARVLDGSAPTLLLRESDPLTVLHELWQREIRQVWLEGGPTLAAAFVRAGLVDEVIAYLAPVLLGDGTSAVGGLGITTMDAALRLNPYDVTTLGPDVRVRATLVSPGQKGH
jgi:diaminohydroxyphosphoribosylaminopyrimidine deaminase/5-amino-6-(5-phosphoribosylamino)uracil reductase